MTISAGWVSTLQPLETEDDMHSSFEAVYRNWSTSSAMARLLRTADEKELFSNKELKDLWQTMIDTETGANKLKGMLPAKTVQDTRPVLPTAMPTA